MLKNVINNFVNRVQTKYKTVIEENNHLNELLQTSETFHNLLAIPENLKERSEYNIAYIMNNSPDINMEKATIISQLIPIDETYLITIFTKELKTGKEYYLIPTTKQLWLISQEGYLVFPYGSLNCQVIKDNLMGKTLLLQNVLLEANGNNEKITSFLSILLNANEREKIIQEKISYLCGIVPISQERNKYGFGISIDQDSNIVFHTKEENYKYSYSEIKECEILLDNQVYFSTKNMSGVMIAFQGSCYQISIRVKTEGEHTFILPILEPSAFGTKYQRQDKTFQENIAFARKIIDKIISLNPRPY